MQDDNSDNVVGVKAASSLRFRLSQIRRMSNDARLTCTDASLASAESLSRQNSLL